MRRRQFASLAAAAVAAVAAGRRISHASGARSGGARVVVVGGGFAGASCALALSGSCDVMLIDPDERYVTCPMSNAVIVGLRELESITVTRKGLRTRGVRVVGDRVVAVDTRRRQVRLSRGATVRFDRLVMAPGIRFLWGRPEGYTEAVSARMPHAWQAGRQTELLAAQLSAMRPGGVVAISVPAGPMRCPPGPFERASLIAGFLKQKNPRGKVLIFDANNHFPKQDVFVDAWQALYPGMIQWIPVVEGGAVVRVDPAAFSLTTSTGTHRADVINIIPPQAPSSIAVEAGLASDHGWCPIDPETFESTLVSGVDVIGDACIADPMPKAASSAHAQAGRCARAIVAGLGGHDGLGAGETAMESVCYSLLASDRALSIHARFELTDGKITQLPPPASAAGGPEEVRNAAAWYRRILADSFGA